MDKKRRLNHLTFKFGHGSRAEKGMEKKENDEHYVHFDTYEHTKFNVCS